MQDRHFTAPVDEISGTVNEVSAGGITLKEFPGRQFQFSSVSTSAADMSARILGENNNMTRTLRPADLKHLTRAPDRSPSTIRTIASADVSSLADESKRNLLESDFATRLAWALSKP